MLGHCSLSELPISDYLQSLRSGKAVYFVCYITKQLPDIVYISMSQSYTVRI